MGNIIQQYQYSLEAGKVVGPPTDFVTAADGEMLFDSMCGFSDGSFLISDPDHKMLRYYGADGAAKCTIDIPIAGSTFVASCAFVDRDLYVTTGRNGGDTSGM